MVGLTGDLTFLVNDEEYPAGVRLPTDRPLYVIADIYASARQVTILESPEGKWSSQVWSSLIVTLKNNWKVEPCTYSVFFFFEILFKTEPLLREMKLCSIDVRFKLKLLIHTYRCTHALASSLLCQQYKLRSHSNSTHSTTRSQLTLSLCIPSAARRPGTISPLFTSTLLWNSLPSPIRSASSLHTFRQELQKYLGIPVIRPR